jgi:hypothetical protein
MHAAHVPLEKTSGGQPLGASYLIREVNPAQLLLVVVVVELPCSVAWFLISVEDPAQ